MATKHQNLHHQQRSTINRKQCHMRKPSFPKDYKLHGSRSSRIPRFLRCCSNRRVTVVWTVLAVVIMLVLQRNWETIGYVLRPVWDKQPKPFQYLTHYYANDVAMSRLCSLHGWSIREQPRRVFDAVIFNNELDLLELRFRELMPYVDNFVLLESNTTFTGQGKPLWFYQNMERYAFASSQIFYESMSGRKLDKGEDPFVLEYAQRLAMDDVLKRAGISNGDLLIMSDVDEIPSGHTIDLLRWCEGIPDIMHLQMNSYVYSFEFLVDKDTWRPSVHIYKAGVSEYDHGRQSDLILADSGWHCSFCFRYVEDIVFKMKAYSHADRVKSPSFLELNRVQEIICKGTDLFDMLPEAYTFQDLIAKLGPVPRSFSVVNLPSFLLNHFDEFKYLLPGNCVRERRVQ